MTAITLDVLEKMDQILDKEEHWTKGTEARTADGISTNATDEKACSFCLLGAMTKAYFQGEDREYDTILSVRMVIHQQIQDAQPIGAIGIPNFNDDPKTRFEDVKLVLSRAIEAEKAKTLSLKEASCDNGSRCS